MVGLRFAGTLVSFFSLVGVSIPFALGLVLLFVVTDILVIFLRTDIVQTFIREREKTKRVELQTAKKDIKKTTRDNG